MKTKKVDAEGVAASAETVVPPLPSREEVLTALKSSQETFNEALRNAIRHGLNVRTQVERTLFEPGKIAFELRVKIQEVKDL